MNDNNYLGYTSENDIYDNRNKQLVRWVIIGIVLFMFALLFISIKLLQPKSVQQKQSDNAKVAAREVTSNAEVSDVRVAGNYASAIVKDPNASGQASAGTFTIFKVNNDGSMKQLASGSRLDPLDLLGYGIKFTDQAKLTRVSPSQIQHYIASSCGYTDNNPGYNGFDQSFNPDGWQIDPMTLSELQQKLNNTIGEQNTTTEDADKKIVCINALTKGSDAVTDSTTFKSTFTVPLQFISKSAKVYDHTLTFEIAPKSNNVYQLDGVDL